MALDPRYITDGPLEEIFLNKDSGLPLAGGTVTFYRDSSRITLKTVYELTGAPPNYSYVPLPNPITLSSIGTVQNAGGDNVVIYYYPWLVDGITPDLYYVVVKDSNGVDQFTREAWPNSAAGESPGADTSLPVQNQISNPQFTQILINDVPTLTPSTTTFTVSAETKEFELAPDWTFIITGTGDVTVERIALEGQLKAPTNPPYALSVSTGLTITSCYLRQRFYNNSGLWTSTTSEPLFLSASLVVKNLINVATTIDMFYQASNGDLATPLNILSDTVLALSDYTSYTGPGVEIPLSTDALSGNSGYVDIYISFGQASSVAVTSVQVVPVVNVTSVPVIPYDIASANRAEALMGDYYLPRVTSSPIPSLLTAWDFKLNPAQFGAAGVAVSSVTSTPAYIWDQTICATSSGTAAVSRNAVTGGLVLAPDTANQSLYMIQYLGAPQAKEVLFSRLSSNISAYLEAGGSSVTASVYLYVAPDATAIPILPSSLVAIASNGSLSSLAAGWSIVPRSGLDTPRGALSSSRPTVDQDIKFTGWEVVDSAQYLDSNKFAIVVVFSWTTAPIINIDSISLNKGDLPTRPAPQTASDVLAECQYYYEKSYNTAVYPEAADTNGVILAQMFTYYDTFTPTSSINGRSFGLQYKTIKRTAPTVTLYSTDGTSANVRSHLNIPGSTDTTANVLVSKWTQTGNGQNGVYYLYSSNSPLIGGGVIGTFTEIFIVFHFSADCRLGVIA